MPNFSSVEDTNYILNVLNVQQTEKIICVKENALSDANFILANLMQKILAENGRMCLVILHNTVGHYRNVLNRLGCDIDEKIKNGYVTTIEPLKAIFNEIGNAADYLSSDKESIVRNLFLNVHKKIDDLLKETNEQVYLVIDDVSHLLDLGIDNKYVITFLNYCINLTSNNQVSTIINCHVVNSDDEIISNSLQYVADVSIEVSPLKTGFSHEVTGVFTVKRRNSNATPMKSNTFHYKAMDRVVKIFAPGESIYHLRK